MLFGRGGVDFGNGLPGKFNNLFPRKLFGKKLSQDDQFGLLLGDEVFAAGVLRFEQRFIMIRVSEQVGFKTKYDAEDGSVKAEMLLR